MAFGPAFAYECQTKNATNPLSHIVFTLAHLSDIHLSPMPRARRTELMGKRVLGYVNWHRGRKYVHRREILDLLTRDLVERKPDHIAVTGDLVNLGLPEEFLRAAEWLHHLGPPSHVTAIPGNHDAYVRMHPKAGTTHWRPYMESNPAGELLVPTPPDALSLRAALRRYRHRGALLGHPHHALHRRRQDRHAAAPIARRGLGAARTRRPIPRRAHPSPSASRSGELAARASRCRRTTRVLKQNGAELVLHGHDHQQTVHEIETVSGPAFVVGVPSASEAVEGRVPAARYNEYCIGRNGNGWRIEMIGRSVAAAPEHVWESERRVLRER